MTARRRRLLWLTFVASLAPIVLAEDGANAGGLSVTSNPDALWQIVAECVDRPAGTYCACPAFDRACCEDPHTPDGEVLLARTPEFVAIRDMKACGCPSSFVADLAIPRIRVTGIEDPRRPEGIWPFAWDVARAKILDESAIALVINPADARSQSQMHVHLLRLRQGERDRLDALADGTASDGNVLVTIPDLHAVFAAVVAAVGSERIGQRGVLVMRARDHGFRAVITDRTSPQAFTVNRCS